MSLKTSVGVLKCSEELAKCPATELLTLCAKCKRIQRPERVGSTRATLPPELPQDGFVHATQVSVTQRSGLKRLVRGRFYQGEDGKTWDRKDMLSIDLMAMLSGPLMFMDMGVVMATGWAMFMGAVAGMLTEAMFTGPVMVTGCCRLTGDVILTVLVEMFIWAAMVTGLLVWPRFIAVVMGDETETGVEEAELQTSVLSVEHGERDRRSV